MTETTHRPAAYSKLNTGIYDKNSLRAMLEVERSAQLGSQYTLFSSEYEEVTAFLSSGRAVFGTNLLGFHSDLSSSEPVSVLLDFAYQGAIMHPDSSPATYLGVDALRYTLGSSKVFIGLNEQNERSLSLVPSSLCRAATRGSPWTQ